jgi:hypothetical protein
MKKLRKPSGAKKIKEAAKRATKIGKKRKK